MTPECRMPGCDEPLYAEGLCREDYERFHGDTGPVPIPADTPSTAPTGRLRLSPMRAVVRREHDDPAAVAVYGVYGSEKLAQGAAAMLSGLGIPGVMETVPFYEVTP